MNIDSIRNYPLDTKSRQNKPKLYCKHENEMGMCAGNSEKNVNRGYYSGSFTGLNGAAAKRSSKIFDKILKLCDEHTVIAQNLVALVLAACFRPIAIMSLPGKKNKKDKQYAAGHSIASGVIGFGFSTAIMYPLGIASKKVKEKASKFLDEERIKKIYGTTAKELQHSKSFGKVSRVLDMAVDVFLFGILKAKLTIALIPPILKYGFGVEKSKPQELQQTKVTNFTASDDKFLKMKSLIAAKPDMSKFVGGQN